MAEADKPKLSDIDLTPEEFREWLEYPATRKYAESLVKKCLTYQKALGLVYDPENMDKTMARYCELIGSLKALHDLLTIEDNGKRLISTADMEEALNDK